MLHTYLVGCGHTHKHETQTHDHSIGYNLLSGIITSSTLRSSQGHRSPVGLIMATVRSLHSLNSVWPKPESLWMTNAHVYKTFNSTRDLREQCNLVT